MDLRPQELAYIQQLVRERAAIVLEDEKEYLIHSRLDPLAKELGFASLATFIAKLREIPYGTLHQQTVEAMTTNETSFFRDSHPFDAIRETVLPDLFAQKRIMKNLNIWCGASASGQEPYSLVLLLHEDFPEELKTWTIRIFATDFSSAMVARCQEGKFSQLEVNRGLPAPLLLKYFQKNGTKWTINKDIRKMIEFREMNLVGTWIPFPRMDLILLRNVLIYFGVDTKKTILGKIRHTLNPQGYLALGGSETTFNLDNGFERVGINGVSFYRLCQGWED